MVVPTRGVVADMGPALSHADKIIRLYMDGSTETEIVRRTGHSYESVESYLLDFAKVTYLLERGLPVPAIRKVMGCSRRLVEKYVNLRLVLRKEILPEHLLGLPAAQPCG